MRFTVIWLPSAVADLAALWTDNPPLRREITAAPDRIDKELRTDAHIKGYAIDNCRILRVTPLVVINTAELDDRRARVAGLSLAPE
jgi:hypothetical protein